MKLLNMILAISLGLSAGADAVAADRGARERLVPVVVLEPVKDLTPAEFERAWSTIIALYIDGVDEAAITRIAVDSVARNSNQQDLGAGASNLTGAPLIVSLAEKGRASREPLLRLALKDVVASLGGLNALERREQYSSLPHAAASIGLMAKVDDGAVTVAGTVTGSPARRAGLAPGDRILSIDGEPARPDLPLFISRLKGAPGSVVTLAVARGGEGPPVDVAVERQVVRQTGVDATRSGNITRLWLSSLPQGVTTAVTAAVVSGHADAEGSASYILDLRSNTGGLLLEAAAVADVFLGRGEIAMVREKGESRRYTARRADASDARPLVVLVDSHTASGGEIIAAALKENRRAVVIGVNTYGAGAIRTAIPLNRDDLLTLTTGRVFDPSGKSLDGAGVTPDVIVSATPEGPTIEVSGTYVRTGPFDQNLLLAAAADQSDVSADLAQLQAWRGDAVLAYAVRLLRRLEQAQAAPGGR